MASEDVAQAGLLQKLYQLGRQAKEDSIVRKLHRLGRKAKARTVSSLRRVSPRQSDLDVWVRFRPSNHTVGKAGTSKALLAANADNALMTRISTGYRKAYASFGSDPAWFAWLGEIKRRHHDTLLEGSSEAVAELLRAPARSTLHYGFDEMYRKSGELDHGVSHIISSPSWIYDLIRRVAEAIGTQRLQYPELMPFTRDFPPSVEDLLATLDDAFGFRIDFPNAFPDEAGLVTTRGIASFRSIQSLFQAYRMHQELLDRPSRNIVEIGAGLGRTAYYMTKFGFDSYTIVDLPLTLVAQANYLGRVLGPDRISVHGEDAAASAIKLMPPHELYGTQPTADLFANFDGLTEQPQATATAYWNYIVSKEADFLSINHEANAFTFRELYQATDSVDFEVTRIPFWLRHGYVDEMVHFDPARKSVTK